MKIDLKDYTVYEVNMFVVIPKMVIFDMVIYFKLKCFKRVYELHKDKKLSYFKLIL